MISHPKFRSRAAFTLIELLVVITIIGVLSAISLSVLGKVRESGDRVRCLSNMRQLGVATLTYGNDHNNTLPGPCAGGQSIYYTSTSLLNFLGPYLGLPDTPTKQIVELMRCPSWRRVAKQPTAYSDPIVCYVLDDSLAPTTGQPVFLPFGYIGISGPMPIARLVTLEGMGLKPGYVSSATTTFSMTSTMLLTDADQVNMSFNGAAGWYSNLPKTPVHGAVRNSIFYDMHAEARSATLIP